MAPRLFKTFDCVEFQDSQAQRIFEETRGMSRDQELAYWREMSAKIRKKWAGDDMETRHARGDRRNLDRILARVPDVPPPTGDEL